MRPTLGEARRGLVSFAFWLFFAALAVPAASFETDQYLALEAEIEDSAEIVNRFLNQELQVFLDKPRVARLECRQLPILFYRSVFRDLFSSRLQKFLKNDPGVDRFPDGWSYRKHLSRSIYRKPWFPFFLPLSPTIRIGEVRFGLDKFGHFFGFGRRYYRRYQNLRARGLSEDEAERRVVRRGFHEERLIVGGLADGVFSHADLEANYQGMELAKAFCHGDNPYVDRLEGKWRPQREIDLREYVTPSFDESYNNNHYPRPRWNRVRPILATEYCDIYFSPAVQARMARYRQLDRPNASKRFVEDYFAAKGRDPQAHQSMSSICNRSTAAVAAASAER